MAADDMIFLTERNEADLAALLAAFRSGRLTVQPIQAKNPLPARIETYLARAAGTITARSGDVLGSGQAAILRAAEDPVDTWSVEASNASNVTVYNRTEQEIETGTEFQVLREPISGRLVVVREDSDGSPHGPFVRGKLDGSMAYQGSATLSLWAHNGTAEADTGVNVTVHDWLLSTGQTIAAGKQVDAYWHAASGRYYVGGSQCS